MVEFLAREIAELEEVLGWRGRHDVRGESAGILSNQDFSMRSRARSPGPNLTGVKDAMARLPVRFARILPRAGPRAFAPMTEPAAVVDAAPLRGLPQLVIRGRGLLPIVQGGMGVGISAHRLAGAVARLGALGTISSVDLRRHHADLMRETIHCRDRSTIDQANLLALDREIIAARGIAGG